MYVLLKIRVKVKSTVTMDITEFIKNAEMAGDDQICLMI